MKKIIISLVLFFLSYTSTAQTNYYRGEWTVKDKSSLFTCICKIEIAKDGIVRGELIWKFISIDSSNAELVKMYKGKRFTTGIEYTEGRYEPGTGDIYMQTEEMKDPHYILGHSKYYLKLSADKKVLYGTSTNPDGEDPGLLYLTRQDPSAAKEFNSLKKLLK